MKIKLSDTGKIITGNTPKTSDKNNYFSKDIPFVKPSDIDENRIIRIDNTEYWISDYARSSARIIPANSVLVTCIGIIGKVAITAKECAFNQQINAIVPYENKFLPEYISYAILAKQKLLQEIANAPVVPIINKTQFSNIEIIERRIEEQRSIVNKLKKLSAIILNKKQQIEKLDTLIKSRFVEMFGNLKLNSKGWEIFSFAELSEIITDGEHATPNRTTEGIYLLSARNVLNHAIQLDDVDYISQEEYDRISRRIIPQAGDVLISCSGSVGRCCSVPEGLKFQMVRSTALIRFKKMILPIFAEYMITSDFVQEQIESSKTISSQANLFQGKIAKLKGFAPPVELQKTFITFVKQTDKSKLAVQKSIEKLEILKKSLMQEYFG